MRKPIAGCSLLLGLVLVVTGRAETVPLDLSSALTSDLLGTDAERWEAIAYHDAFPTVDYTLHHVFGDHDRLGGPFDCYYVDDQYGLPEDGVVTTPFGTYQLAPPEEGDVTEHLPAPNAVGFGKLLGEDPIVGEVTLPVDEQAHYSAVNFLLCHWYAYVEEGVTPNLDIRILALYAGGTQELLYEGAVPDWNGSGPEGFQAACSSDRFITSSGTNPCGVTIGVGTRTLWEFAAPLSLNSASVLTGFRFEVATVSDGAENFAAVLAASATPFQGAGEPIEVALQQDYSWCYQNAPETTEGRHRVQLTVEVVPPDPNGNDSYSVEITETQGLGRVSIEPTADPMIWDVLGACAEDAAAGETELEIAVTGNENGGYGVATTTVTVRPIGDVDGNGFVNVLDKVYFNKALNGLATPFADRAYDLTGEGAVNVIDKVQMNRVLNGQPVP